ncbi:unnamed protein product [Trichogramma brassicae]|uniref:Aminopeptidase n=1 Tax=Trichogramma brassicae TaxID=86971 RepID=A0A6H5IJH5_9HYME|nr:unnamed protein product [Trichogramma brassicae]
MNCSSSIGLASYSLLVQWTDVLAVLLPAVDIRQERSVDLNEQHKLESVCICDDLRPKSYILEIEPLVQEAKFKGRVRINVTWSERADKVMLHVHPDLQISHSNVRVTRLNDVIDESDSKSQEEEVKAPAPLKILKIERNPRKLIIHLENMLKRNTTCEVDITYLGNITTNDTSGLFMNYYMDAAKQKHTYVATYLRLNNARKMFPSFDELQYKTKFQLILTRPKNMTALSNTPIEKTVPVVGEQEVVQDHFMQIPDITTYQVAFVISDFESLSPTKKVNAIDGRELQVRVWGRKEYLDALKDVPDKIVTIVNYMQDYFNSSIGLPKLDVIAMPIYTASKASDNWGLMIFKESELSSPLIWNTAYELTYQWIGQLITPFRWMDASENKGLNSFLASKTTMDKPYVRETRKSPNSWESTYRWNIPLVKQTQSKWNNDDYSPKTWLLTTMPKDGLNVPSSEDKNEFIVINPQEIGLFPVNYDSHNWQLLATYLQSSNFETIPTLTRAKLLHDSWNLAYADELCFSIALNMTLSLRHEKSHIVWEPFFTMIDHVGKRIEGSPVFSKFEEYSRLLLEPLYTEPCEVAPANEPSWKSHLRGLARYFLCRAGYEPCIAEAREQYAKWMSDPEPDKGNPVANEFICPVFKWGTDEEWNFGLQRVINFPKNSLERKQSERTYLLKTLAGCPQDPAKIERLLNIAIMERNGNLSDADCHLIFAMLTGNANGYKMLFKFLHDNWDQVKQRLENKKNLWISIIHSATGFFNTQEGYDLVTKLHAERQKELSDSEASLVREAMESIKQETKWSEKNLPAIDVWLTDSLARKVSVEKDLLDYWKAALACPKINNSTSAAV